MNTSMNAARCVFILLFAVLSGCANYAPVPVVERNSQSRVGNVVSGASSKTVASGMYLVKKGDTLYSIALDHGLDYRDVVAWNQLENVNLIKVDQLLRVAPPEGDVQVAVAKPVTSSGSIETKSASNVAGMNTTDPHTTESFKRAPKGGKVVFSANALARAQSNAAVNVTDDAASNTSKSTTNIPVAPVTTEPKVAEVPAATEKPALSADIGWAWPTNGKMLAPFAEGSSKGIDLAGKLGDPVHAAADGVVSYAGAGLRGYGNLVVLRHNATWLSVYAHNSKILVKEKQAVKRGQTIAEVGSSDAESPRLHFEIRQQGKSVDPQKILPVR
ncbi:MAG: LysM peptidoglycan-binding domain-containing protein [Rugosibacter sp.]|nr:MAG: LysM peptidoglycan-binding domain-containing protein [Rugosibacter sp.]